VWKRGAHILENSVDVPFKAARAFMYDQKELIQVDALIYEHYKQHKDMRTKMAQSIHDYCIK
jgi:hypothetical protein